MFVAMIHRSFGLMLVAAIALLAGCASSSPPAMCDSSCAGCCDGTTCVVATDDNACGTGGNLCQKCRSNETCTGGICKTTACNGCVDASSKACAAGNTDAQCGAAGGTCTKCTTGTTCRNGVCASSACMGCMDSAGKCQMGTTDTQCGSGGKACTACTGAQKCADKACVAPPTCSPANCPTGCCDDADKCVTDSTEEHCGITGGRCATCSGTQTCVQGVCKAPCMETCAGCCDSTGACLASVKENCGKPGADCVACVGSDICSEGSCITMACKQSCSGCCMGDTCVQATGNSACGASGNACVACGPMQVCVAGACRVEPASKWDLVIVSATVPETDPNGESWDAFGGRPDPYARITLDFGGANLSGNTASIDGTYEPVWNNTSVANNRTAELLQKVTYIELFDYDPAGSDQSMGLCSYMFSNPEFDGTLREIVCPGPSGFRWKLRFRLVPHV